MSDQPISVREVLLQLLAAERYPRYSRDDWLTADIMEAEALTKAASAVPSPSDPPEFAGWLTSLKQKNLSAGQRAVVYYALQEYFERENVQ